MKNLTFWRSDTSTTILLHQKVQLDKFVTPRKRVDHPMQTLWENRAFCTKKMLLRAKQFMSQESMWRCQMGCGAPKCWLKRLTSSPGLHMTKKPFRDVTTSLSCTFWRGKSGWSITVLRKSKFLELLRSLFALPSPRHGKAMLSFLWYLTKQTVEYFVLGINELNF